MDPKLKEMMETFYCHKFEDPKPLTPEETEQFQKRGEELAARPMTEERIRELTQDGQEDF